MAEGVEKAAVVCCFMTPDYQKSDNCRLELEYANKKKKRIVPCMLGDEHDKKWTPSGWLGFITAALNYINMREHSETNIRLKAEELISRIRNQSPMKPKDSSSKESDFFETVRHTYIENSYIQRMMNEKKSFPIEQSYINLSIIETKEQEVKEKNLRQSEHNDAIISSFEEIYGNKTSVDIIHIFERCKNPTKKVLVLGRAGIGKSTFCRYVSYRWAKGELWTQYQLVILIHLRSLTSTRYPSGQEYSPMDLVKKEYFPFDTVPNKDRERFKEWCKKAQVLWLLDGYDEFVQNIPEQLKDLFEHILKTQHHILTSRPYSVALFYDVKMEITGFTDDNIGKYVEQFFDQIKDQLHDASSEAQKLLNFLKTNPSIWGVAHIPVNLELICSFWGDIDKSQANIFTMTGLYDTMIEWLCRRYLAKCNIDHVKMKKRAVYVHCKRELAFLESLAFHGMKDNYIILRPDLLENVEKQTSYSLDDHPELLKIGILHSLNDRPTGSNIKSQINYYFVHLSFQEHFAARYLVNALASSSSQEAIEFIKNNKYNQRFALVFTFASGLLTDKTLKLSQNTFWDTLEAEPLDLVGFRHIQLVISCLEEVRDGSDVSRHPELIDSISRWIKYTVPKGAHTIHNSLDNSLQRGASLVKEQAIIDQIIELLNDSHSAVRCNACSLISKLSVYNPQTQFVLPLTVALEDENEDVKQRACEALGEMGEKAATREVISNLVSLIEDESFFVRMYAREAFVKMSEKGAMSKVISGIMNALENENDCIRVGAYRVLGEISKKTATNEVISILVNALANNNSGIRISACGALGEMGEKGATSHVISKLVSAVGDEDEGVRASACKALGDIGEKAATSEVINHLVTALGDRDEKVRENACWTLGKMPEKAATDEVISKLLNVLEDDNESVLRGACWALEEMGEKAATDEVISKLLNLLEDENGSVIRGACEALGEMGEKAATSDVISKLVNARRNTSRDVRIGTERALCKIGEKAATNEVISKLVNALGDEDDGLRDGACTILETMGNTTATNEVISKLVSAAENEISNVRLEVCRTLGKLGEEVATDEVISKLMSALEDKISDVRMEACWALGKMGEKAATSHVISKLVSAVGGEDEGVRASACKALGDIGEKAATSEVINSLANAVEDKNGRVRGSACMALGKIGGKGANSEVITKLVNALNTFGDEYKWVRWNACKGLREIGEKAATSEVVNALVNALADEDEDVRGSACEALGEMGGKAATREVIRALANSLRDEDTGVRSCACKTLGKMDEKAITNEVIKELLQLMEDTETSIYYDAKETLEKFFTYVNVMKTLDPDTLSEFSSCLDRYLWRGIRFFSPEIFIKIFLYRQSSPWLSVATTIGLLEGVGVTVSQKMITVYGSKEPVKLDCNDQELLEELTNAFMEQSETLDLPCMRPRIVFVAEEPRNDSALAHSSIPNENLGSKKHSSMCVVL